MHVATQQIQAEMGWPHGRGLLRMESGAEMRLEAWGHRRGFGLPCICQRPEAPALGSPGRTHLCLFRRLLGSVPLPPGLLSSPTPLGSPSRGHPSSTCRSPVCRPREEALAFGLWLAWGPSCAW